MTAGLQEAGTGQPAAPVALEAEGLVLRRGDTTVVDGYELSLRRGEIVGLLGVNGAGKTSTLRMLAGVLPPTQGRIRVLGNDLHAQPRAARRAIGFVPDRPPLYDELTVREYLELAATLHGLRRGQRTRAADRAIERCGLEGVRQRLIGQLSLGYRQRLDIAQGIVHEPEVILLDEPTSALDPMQTRSVRALIRELGSEHAVLISSHLLGEIESLCHRVQFLSGGRVVTEHRLPLAEGWLLELAAPTDPERIAAIQGIGALEAGSEGLRLQLDQPPEQVLKALCAAGVPVRSFAPARAGLEALFVEEVLRAEGDGT